MALILGLAALVGAHLSHVDIPLPALIMIYVAQACIAAGGFAMNDVLDQGRDAGVSAKPISSGRISVRVAAAVSTLLIVAGVVVASRLSGYLALFAVGQCLLVWLYSSIKLWSGIVANWITAGLCASGFMFGSIYAGSVGLSWFPILLTLEIILARELVKDALDIDVDFAAGVKTVPINFGLRSTHKRVYFIILASICTSMAPLLLGIRLNVLSVAAICGIMFLLLAILVRYPLFSKEHKRKHAGVFLNASALGFLFALAALWHLGN